MRQFIKFMFASMLGTILAGGFLLFLFFASLFAIGAAFSGERKPTGIKDGSVLLLKLDKEIVDRGPRDPFQFDFGPFAGAGRIGLDHLLEDLEKAARDERIRGIMLDLTLINAGTATVQEIRDKLIEFRESSGKPVIAYSEFYTQKSYYLASAADAVYVVPEGDLDFRGLRADLVFFKGLFEKMGVDIQFIKGSDNIYKSFGESYTEKAMSPANKEQMTALIASLWSHYLDAVGTSRKIDKAELNTIAEELRIRYAPDAERLGLVDGVKYKDEVLDILRERIGLEPGEEIPWVGQGQYRRASVSGGSTLAGQRSSRQRVAIVYAEGGISSGRSSDGTIGSETLSDAIRKAREDSTIKAIVLRVNSPGGSGLASDVIWREVQLARDAKPVVVSMGDVAASGGYYIACGANKIFADPTTITGSIGVFGMIPNMQGLLNDKLGITTDGVKTNRWADLLDVSRPMRPEERQLIQDYVDKFYTDFKQRVADGRGMTVEQVDAVGRGRVWTGSDALRIGLVDELGGLERAIQAAAELAGLEDYRTVAYPEREDLFMELMKELGAEAHVWMRHQLLGADAELLERFAQVARIKQAMGIQARMPFEIHIH